MSREQEANAQWRADELKPPCGGDAWELWEQLSDRVDKYQPDGPPRACYTCNKLAPIKRPLPAGVHVWDTAKCLGMDGPDWEVAAAVEGYPINGCGVD
jgi:hypothetical protein